MIHLRQRIRSSLFLFFIDSKDGKGVKRHDVVTGISAPLRQRRTQLANDNEPAQGSQPTHENGVVAPVQVSGRPTRARQYHRQYKRQANSVMTVTDSTELEG